jgi:hypothetical protein
MARGASEGKWKLPALVALHDHSASERHVSAADPKSEMPTPGLKPGSPRYFFSFASSATYSAAGVPP